MTAENKSVRGVQDLGNFRHRDLARFTPDQLLETQALLATDTLPGESFTQTMTRLTIDPKKRQRRIWAAEAVIALEDMEIPLSTEFLQAVVISGTGENDIRFSFRYNATSTLGYPYSRTNDGAIINKSHIFRYSRNH